MANSLMQIISDGSLSTIPLTIKFFEQSHIKVFVNNVELPDGTYTFAWAGANTITITPAVALGAEVSIRRKTPSDEVIHDFQAGAVFSEVSVDENFQQELFLLQEASEQSLVTDLFDDLDMHGNKVRNLGPAVLPGDAVNLAQAQLLADGGEASTLRAELATPSGSSIVGFQQAGPTPSPRTVQEKVREVVSVNDFVGANYTIKFANAFSYLLATPAGGGEVLVPAGTYVADLDVPSNITVRGTGEKTIIKGATKGVNSCTVKLSNSVVGAYPYGLGKIPNKNVRLKDLVIDADGADFGLYKAYCLFPDVSGVTIYRAKVRNLYMAAVFSYSLDKVLLSYGESLGGSIGDNLFGWVGGVEGIHCNAGNARRLLTFGNGTAATYDKTSAPTGGVGLLVEGGSGNNFTSYQGEQNKGPGLYVAPNTQATFHGIYLEANANDGTSDHRQCVNESTGAVFYDVEPRFNAEDTFHCAAHTRIFNYFGNRITGPGPASVYGKYDATAVENPNVQTVALVERLAFNTGSGRIRMNMLKPAPRATEGFYKTGIYEMGAFVSFKSTVTVGTGGSAKTILITTITGTVLTTITIPPATYNDGDLIYVKFNLAAIGSYSVVEMGFGGGAVINTVDCGIYAKFMV